MDLLAYLDRIGHQGTLRPDLETLRGILRAHGRTIPYENLDVRGEPDEAAIAERCAILQSAPTSPFVQNAIVARRTPDCVQTLIGRVLRSIRPQSVEKQRIDSVDEYVATLEQRFGLALPEAAALWPAICERHEQIEREKALRAAAARTAAPV